jgi:anti-sigma-K factor RskA
MNANYNHSEFEELCVLASAGALAGAERQKLERHLRTCADCWDAYQEYRLLSTEGMSLLASTYARPQTNENWDDRAARKALLARVRTARAESEPEPRKSLVRIWAFAMSPAWVRVAAVAGCVVVAVGYGSYRLGQARQAPIVVRGGWASSPVKPSMSMQRQSLDNVLASQINRISSLEQEASRRQAELDGLHSAYKMLEDRSAELASANEKFGQGLAANTAQRKALSGELAKAQQAYEATQQELATIQNERDKSLSQVASLETNIEELKLSNTDQERRLKDGEQYLAADRDIRELMGARKLYIADVFDVDSRSRTRRPFGRVFYTESKSLIFYAFDLDREPGIKNATFQVWGEKDAPQGEKAHPLNLGVLFMDSESNRRWVLRTDDAKQLAEIDAVFVTVEPHGGSRKPTSKPFLYALLRKEANHP